MVNACLLINNFQDLKNTDKYWKTVIEKLEIQGLSKDKGSPTAKYVN